MGKSEIRRINGADMFLTKRVRHNGRIYREYKSVNALTPNSKYIDEESDTAATGQLEFDLRLKFAMSKKSFFGEDAVYIEDTNVYGGAENSDIEKQLQDLHEADMAKISSELAKKYPDIFTRQGINNPKQWIEDKLRGKDRPGKPPHTGYQWENGLRMGRINASAAGCVWPADGTISLAPAFDGGLPDESTRIHEMAHRLSAAWDNEIGRYMRFGLLVMRINTEIVEINGEKFKTLVESGRAINEGVTDLITRKVLDSNSNSGAYIVEDPMANDLARLVGIEKIIESYLFNPDLLAQAMTEISGDECCYAKMMYYLDEYQRLKEATPESLLWIEDEDLAKQGLTKEDVTENEKRVSQGLADQRLNARAAYDQILQLAVNPLANAKNEDEAVKAAEKFGAFYDGLKPKGLIPLSDNCKQTLQKLRETINSAGDKFPVLKSQFEKYLEPQDYEKEMPGALHFTL